MDWNENVSVSGGPVYYPPQAPIAPVVPVARPQDPNAQVQTLGYNPNGPVDKNGNIIPPNGFNYITGTNAANGYQLDPQFQIQARSVNAGQDVGYNGQATNQLNQNLQKNTAPVQVGNILPSLQQNYASIPAVQNQDYYNTAKQNLSSVPNVNAQDFFSQIQQNVSGLPQIQAQDLTGQLQGNINSANLNQSGLSALQNAATQQGPSDWLKGQLQLQKLQQGTQLDQANQGAQGAEAAAISQLQNQGGLRSGQGENLARQAMMNAQQAQQGVLAQGAQTQAGLQVQDEANKNAFLSQLPQAQLQAANYGLTQANAGNTAAEQQQGVQLQAQGANQALAENVASSLNAGAQNQANLNQGANLANQSTALSGATNLNTAAANQAAQNLASQQANQGAGLTQAGTLSQAGLTQQALQASTGLQNNAQAIQQAGLVDTSQLSEQNTALANAQANRATDLGVATTNAANAQNVQQTNVANNLGQLTQQNAANLTSYGQQMQAWAAQQTGNAQANSGKK